ncbi:MAG TPA: hypothetical protein VN192_01715 [Flavobacterium sp.]|nr:hypothetical protein [Flavobacterium sp.]
MENTKVKTMITAKELFDKMLSKNNECTSTEMMIEFAKLHVKQALKCAAKASESFDFSEEDELFKMNQENILTAYDLDNVV